MKRHFERREKMRDSDIVDLYWKRSELAIKETEKKYGRYCYSISYNILQNSEEAKECVNDTYLGAWESMPPNRPSRLSTYLGKITRNLSLNRFKYYSAEKRGLGQTELALVELEDCISSKFSVEQVAEEKMLVQVLETFLWNQKEQKRNMFIRRYWYLQSIKEIARDYRMSESKVTSLLFRVRKELKEYLEKEGIVL